MPRFKNVISYRIDPAWQPDLARAEEQLQAHRFVPCGATQELSAGWVAPRSGGGDHGALAESVAGQWLLEYMIERKALPGAVVRREVDARAAKIEAETGRKPGKKERRQLKEDTVQALLPMAFTQQARVAVWIDPRALRLTLDTANATRADAVVSGLVEALGSFGVQAVHTELAPASAMAEWLATQEAPAGFSIDRECELKATDESKAAVRYAKHALDIEEVRQHIAAGKRPTRLAMTWEDRVSFELTEGLTLRKLSFLDGVLDGTSEEAQDDFDTDAAIVTGELGRLLPALMEALGGETAASAPRGQARATEEAPF